MKNLLKKLRWKWHHDLTDQMDADAGVLRELNKKMSDNLSELENIKQETKANNIREQVDKLEAIQEQIKHLEGKCASYESKLAQIQKSSDLDHFAQRVEIEKVFNLMKDRESQKLFWTMIHWYQKKDLVPMYRHLIQSNRPGDPKDVLWMLKNRLNTKNPKDELIIFGTNYFAKEFLLVLRELGCRVDYICKHDNETKFNAPSFSPVVGYDWEGTPVITEAEFLSEHKDAKVVIVDSRYGTAKNYLISKGIPENNIFIRSTMYGLQYFEEDITIPHQHEVFIDGGVLDLKSTLDFIKWCGGEYDAVYAFEPDGNNYKNCMEKIQNDPLLDERRVHLLNSALWSKDEELVFQEGNAGASKVIAGGNSSVQGRSIDSVLQGARVTFIKMDIEGSELSALVGARESIKKWKPRLAISIYHKQEDPIEIPLYIHELVPEYKMYIRHYSTSRWETVLYCVCDDDL